MDNNANNYWNECPKLFGKRPHRHLVTSHLSATYAGQAHSSEAAGEQFAMHSCVSKLQWASTYVSPSKVPLPMGNPPPLQQTTSELWWLEGKRGDYLTSSVLLCIIIVHIICIPIQWAVCTRSTGSGFDLAWLSCLPSASVSSVYLVLYVENFYYILFFTF